MIAMLGVKRTVNLAQKTEEDVAVATLLLGFSRVGEPEWLASKEGELMGEVLGKEGFLGEKAQVNVVLNVVQVDC